MIDTEKNPGLIFTKFSPQLAYFWKIICATKVFPGFTLGRDTMSEKF